MEPVAKSVKDRFASPRTYLAYFATFVALGLVFPFIKGATLDLELGLIYLSALLTYFLTFAFGQRFILYLILIATFFLLPYAAFLCHLITWPKFEILLKAVSPLCMANPWLVHYKLAVKAYALIDSVDPKPITPEHPA